ncbi:hypothetical protein C5706_33130, partial [Klebsiella pneumoniae]
SGAAGETGAGAESGAVSAGPHRNAVQCAADPAQQYSAQSQALLAKPELAQNPELYQQALTETLFNALPILL